MMYKPQQVIDFLKKSNISLCQNDLLMTGTPKGVGIINPDDTFILELSCNEEVILEAEFK